MKQDKSICLRPRLNTERDCEERNQAVVHNSVQYAAR